MRRREGRRRSISPGNTSSSPDRHSKIVFTYLELQEKLSAHVSEGLKLSKRTIHR
jgi:hypothetical protein